MNYSKKPISDWLAIESDRIITPEYFLLNAGKVPILDLLKNLCIRQRLTRVVFSG